MAPSNEANVKQCSVNEKLVEASGQGRDVKGQGQTGQNGGQDVTLPGRPLRVIKLNPKYLDQEQSGPKAGTSTGGVNNNGRNGQKVGLGGGKNGAGSPGACKKDDGQKMQGRKRSNEDKGEV